MESLIHKDQVHILLNKVEEIVDNIDTNEWPSNVKWDMVFGSNKINSVNVTLKRCNITIVDCKDRLKIEFKVGIHSISGNYKLPNFFVRRFLPGVWRRWKKVGNKLISKHKEHVRIVNNKALEAQREVFNDLYYTQFPEDIEDILLDRENDDE